MGADHESEKKIREPKVVSDLNSLALTIFDVSKKIPKHWRPSLGRKLENLALDSLLATKRFAMSPHNQKLQDWKILVTAVENFDDLETMISICHELRCLSDGKFGEIAESIVTIRKQLYGLKKKYAPITRSSSVLA